MSRKLFSSLVLALGAMAFQASGAANAENADPVTFTPLPAVPFSYAMEPAAYGIDGSRVVGTYYNNDDGEDCWPETSGF